MAAPKVSSATQRLFDALPEVYRAADEVTGDRPLLRYLSVLGDLAGEMETLVDRIDYLTPDERVAAGLPAYTGGRFASATGTFLQLLRNPTYELALLPAHYVTGYNAAALEMDTTVADTGGLSLKVTTTGGSSQGLIHLAPPETTVPAGTVVTAAMRLRGPAGAVVLFSGRVTGLTDALVAEGLGQVSVTMTGNWQDLATTYTYTADFRPGIQWTCSTAGVFRADTALAQVDPPPPNLTTSELADPNYADAAWLPWLAQLTGTRMGPRTSTAERRAGIAAAVGGWQAGTRSGIAQAARTVLTGDRYVTLYMRWQGSPWQIGIATVAAETPSAAIVLDAVARAGAKPAGFRLVHTFYSLSWATLEATYTTWAAVETKPTWQALEATQ